MIRKTALGSLDGGYHQTLNHSHQRLFSYLPIINHDLYSPNPR